MIIVTGATGQLGRLVIDNLLKRLPASQIVAAVRSPEKAADLACRGVEVRQADYERPETLVSAFKGATRLLLISSSEIGRRTAQHRAVIDAAKQAGVSFLVYTSLLHADTSPLGLAEEHRETEALIGKSGIPAAILRNGWYSENYLASVPTALKYGALLGCAANGRIASAARADYAEAAATVLSSQDTSGRILELAGDTSYSLDELASEISRKSGTEVIYRDLPQDEYKSHLAAAGLPEAFAALLADSDAGAARGALFDDSHTLSRLIGRPTTPISAQLDAALKPVA